MQFYDSEIKVLNVLWRYGELAAGEVAKILGEEELRMKRRSFAKSAPFNSCLYKKRLKQ